MTAPEKNGPARPERAPGCGRDMPAKHWQDDAWLPEPQPDPAEMQETTRNTIDQLLERPAHSVVRIVGGRPGNVLETDALLVTSARLLEWYMKRVYGTQGG